ncbi:DUF1254 domain-containing protein [Streptomyces sp. NPDC015414]|uniref:DUF1254 domain-containing protein n=1 Tax=Streptomyces sp. NPDC015414 TaxID=3364957 RepID=UPI0036F8997B
MAEPSQTPAWRRIPEDAVGAAAAVARAAAHATLHPRSTLDRARRLPEIVPALGQAVKTLTGRTEDWRVEYAYTLGEQAYVYGFPYIYYAELRHAWVTQPRNPATIPYAPVNHFWHAEQLLDATYRDGGCPNNDTMYSVAWVNLGSEPVILSHPDMGDRYFTFELVGMTSDNFAYVGQRTTGSDAGNFALVGPNWKGKPPEGVRRLKKAPSPWILILGRTLVNGPDDVPQVRELQEHYRLTPLSLYGQPEAKVPESRDVLTPIPVEEDPLGPWKTLNAMLAENPPPSHHQLLLEQFAQIAIGPGLDVEAQPEAVKQSLIRAAAVGLPLLRQQILSGDWAHLVNGWRYPPTQMGRFGDDFLKRAADQALLGVAANDPAEAVYLLNFDDADGNKLVSDGRYELHFRAGALPPVDAFWSLSAYQQDMNLIPNEADRYSIGDRTAGLQRDEDGGLTIHLQSEPPDQGRESNWLPTAKRGNWFVALRMYRPHAEVIDAVWECPPLTRVA